MPVAYVLLHLLCDNNVHVMPAPADVVLLLYACHLTFTAVGHMQGEVWLAGTVQVMHDVCGSRYATAGAPQWTQVHAAYCKELHHHKEVPAKAFTYTEDC